MFAIPYIGYGKIVNVNSLDDLKRASHLSDNTIVVRKHINLNGTTIDIAPFCQLKFKGGSLRKGTVIGNKTKIKAVKHNVFHDCIIKGSWRTNCSYSLMFDNELDAIILLKNLSILSSTIALHAERTYHIDANDEEIEIETIEAIDSHKKPLLDFHTTNPDVVGLNFKGNNITIRNIKIRDDYSTNNDKLYGKNNPLIGNTITVKAGKDVVKYLTLDGCDFRGGTSSSFIASSQVQNCQLKNCTFSGYMADHGIYCSMKAESFIVENCSINDVTHVNGLFKVRTSDKLRKFKLSKVKAHNYNGYLAMISLLKTPEAEVVLENIKVTKDVENNSVFYGFCMNDETKSLMGRGYNARSITLSNCHFGYGYEGNSVVYSGAGNRICVKEIVYNHIKARESNFGGGVTDNITVKNSRFDDCSGDKGIYLSANELRMEHCILENKNSSNCLLLVNYDHQRMRTITIREVEFDANTPDIINVVGGDEVAINLKGCRQVQTRQNLVKPSKAVKLTIK